MKAIGAGTALSALGGTTVVGATRAEGNAAATQEQDDDGNNGDSGGTVHVVRTLVGPSTNAERPADFFYQPTGIHVQPGDVVRFVFATPDHNVLSIHPVFGMRRRVPTGVGPVSAPVSGWRPSSIPDDQIEPPAEMGGGAGGGSGGGTGGDGGGDDGGENGGSDDSSGSGPVPDTFLLGLETPGVYDFICSPHEAFGMAMRVVVGDETETHFETSNPQNLPEPRVGPAGLARVTLTDPALQPASIVEQGTVRWQDLESTQAGGGGGTGDGGGGGGGSGGGDGDDNDDDGGDDGNDDDSQGGDG